MTGNESIRGRQLPVVPIENPGRWGVQAQLPDWCELCSFCFGLSRFGWNFSFVLFGFG